MSIGAASLGMTARSPSNKMSDVELGSSSQHGPRRALKTKDSDIGNEEMAPLMISGGDGKVPQSPRGASSTTEGVTGERSSCMKSLIASAMYSGCSVGMVLVNKSLASRYVIRCTSLPLNCILYIPFQFLTPLAALRTHTLTLPTLFLHPLATII
jgi:hypothetical protein